MCAQAEQNTEQRYRKGEQCHNTSHPHYKKESIYLHTDTSTNDWVCAEGTTNK